MWIQRIFQLIQLHFHFVLVCHSIGIHLSNVNLHKYDFIRVYEILFFLFVQDQLPAVSLVQQLQKGYHFLTGGIPPDNDLGFRQFNRFYFDFQFLSPFPICSLELALLYNT